MILNFKPHRRRASDKIRKLADDAWARNDKDTSEKLHSVARQAEAERKIEDRLEG